MPMEFKQSFGTEAGTLKEIAAAVVGAIRAGAPLDARPSVGRKRSGTLTAMYFTWDPASLPDEPEAVAAAVEQAASDAEEDDDGD